MLWPRQKELKTPEYNTAIEAVQPLSLSTLFARASRPPAPSDPTRHQVSVETVVNVVTVVRVVAAVADIIRLDIMLRKFMML